MCCDGAAKIKDRKLGAPVTELLDALCYAVGPWVVISKLISFAQDSKVCPETTS